MTYKLSDITFDNDFYFIERTDGNTIALNVLDEEMLVKYEQDLEIVTEELDLNTVNLSVIKADGSQEITSNIIGLETPYYTIKTDYKEYIGTQLTKGNLAYCTLEVADED